MAGVMAAYSNGASALPRRPARVGSHAVQLVSPHRSFTGARRLEFSLDARDTDAQDGQAKNPRSLLRSTVFRMTG